MIRNKTPILALLVGVSLVFTIIAFTSVSDEIVISDTNETIQYIPSNITKANPNILIGGESSWRTINVVDVAEHVVYSIEGTVLKIGTPIDYLSSETGITGTGLFPITIAVDKVHKGQLDSQTFTFYVGSLFFFIDEDDPDSHFMPDTIDEIQQIINDKNKKYHIFEDSAQFEVGERVLVHLDKSGTREPYMIDDPENFSLINTYYHPILGAYAKYQLQTVTSDLSGEVTTEDNTIAFSFGHPDGIPLESAISEGQ